MSKIVFTINEPTTALGIGRSRLYQLFKEGKLKPRKLGNRTLILAKDLEAFAENLPSKNDGGEA